MSETAEQILQECLDLLKKVDSDLRSTAQTADEALANLRAFSEKSEAFWKEYRERQRRG